MQNTPLNLAQIREGNVAAFQQLFEFYYPKMKALACRFVDEHCAEDITQDTFASLWDGRENFSPENIGSFLYKSIQNRCLNHIKHKSIVENHSAQLSIARQRIAYLDETDSNDVWSYVHHSDLKKAIEEAISTLPPKCAQVFRMSYIEGLTHKEIAEKLGISSRTAESHIYQALTLLRPKLKHLLLIATTLNL